MQILPKPGAWMKWVNKIFALAVLALAAWHVYLAYEGFASRNLASSPRASGDGSALEANLDTFDDVLSGAKRPVLVDCWATWCKNCKVMEKRTMRDEKVKKELERFTVIRLQAEDIDRLKTMELFKDVKGLPAFLIIE